MISVRAAGPEDQEFIAGCNERMAWETEHRRLEPDTIRRGVARALQDPALGRYFVAENSGVRAGCLLVTYEWSDWRNGQFWWVQSVYVEPEHRSRGVYRSLYEEVKRRAAEEGGCCGFRLYVERSNTRAQDTYRRLGMEQTDYLLFEEPVPPRNNY